MCINLLNPPLLPMFKTPHICMTYRYITIIRVLSGTRVGMKSAAYEIWVFMNCLIPGYSDAREFVRMELHQLVSLPPLQSLKVFLEVLAVVFCSECEVYDDVVCKLSD